MVGDVAGRMKEPWEPLVWCLKALMEFWLLVPLQAFPKEL
jgi:predicted Zn-dependent protease